MNVNLLLCCNVCEKMIHCRIGLSYKKIQPLRFVCPTCMSPIDILFKYKTSIEDAQLSVEGALSQDGRKISDANHFVDLHLDFPTHYGEYIMGMTPFIRASKMIGIESMQQFASRIQLLDQISEDAEDIKSLIRFYTSKKWALFKKIVYQFLPENDFPCELPVDRNKCLYQLLELGFMPHNDQKENLALLSALTEDLMRLCEDDPQRLHNFLDELGSTGFLDQLQKDCLEIYPRILDADLIIRPALFLDYIEHPEDKSIALRVSNSTFGIYKDLFKDLSEVLSHMLVLVAGLSNLKLRSSHNLFDSSIKDAPVNLHKFADIPYGRKLKYIDEPSWHSIVSDTVDNHLRNAIAHYKTDYDEVTQVITYFPQLEGLERSKSETISFLEFSRKILESFRVMHKLNHVIKVLYVFQYLELSKSHINSS